MNIYSEVKADHKAVKELLEQLVLTREDSIERRGELFKKIKEELRVHNEAEEEVFYSQLNANRNARLLIQEGILEHALGGQLLTELETMDKETETWTAKAKVLKDLVEHHIEEEETSIHAEAKKELSDAMAKSIGESFVRVKRELKSLNKVA